MGCKDCGSKKIKSNISKKASNNCAECKAKHLSSLYSVLILLTECEQGYNHLVPAVAHLSRAEREGFKNGGELHNRKFLRNKPKQYKQMLYNYLSQHLQFPDIVGFLNLAEEHCTDEQTRQKLYNLRKSVSTNK